MAADPTPLETVRTPHGRTAAGTHDVELERLAVIEDLAGEVDLLTVQTLLWVFRAYSAVNAAQAEVLRPVGLSPSGFNVLMALLKTPGQCLEPCQLADRLLVSRPSITGLLDTLETRGLVERHGHPDDRRRVLVYLTATGTELLEQHVTEHFSQLREVTSDLTDDELEQLISLLRRIRGAVPAHLT